MVQHITVVPRPGAVNAILSLLEAVSPNLKSLRLEAPAEHVFASNWRPANYETLDVKLLGYGLTFMSLTHLVVRKHAARFAETVLEICLAAPALISVDAQEHVHAGKSVWPSDGPMPALAVIDDIELSSIRELRLEYHDYWNSSFHPFIQLAMACDELERLVLLHTPDEDDTREYLVQDLRTKSHLRDMYWEVTAKSFYPRPKKDSFGGDEDESEEEESDDDEDDEYVDGFEMLERLVIGPADYLETLSDLPSSQSLTTLNILEPKRVGRRLEPLRPTRYPEPSPHPTMHPMLAKRLRETPYLSTINSLPVSTMPTFAELDDIEQSDQITGTIRSFVKKGSSYGSDELLHARLYLYHTQISDTLGTARPTYTKPGHTYTTYYTSDGSERLLIYKDCPKGEWVDLTDFGAGQSPAGCHCYYA